MTAHTISIFLDSTTCGCYDFYTGLIHARMEDYTMNRPRMLAAAASLVMLLGCGREYHIQGRVVALTGDAKGSITEVTGKALPETGTPIAGAEVTLYYELSQEGAPVATSTWKRTVTTDEKGRFDLQDYAVPSMKILLGLRVTKEGYETAYTTYWDYKDIEPQIFFVELRKQP